MLNLETEAIKILVDSGAALDLQDVDGFTPMHLAALVGKSDAVEELLLSGANPEIENKIGLTAMHMTKDAQVQAVFQKFMRVVPVTRPKQQKMPEASTKSVIAMRRRNAAKQLEGESKIPSVFISREVRKEVAINICSISVIFFQSGPEAKLLKAELAAKSVSCFVCSDVLKNGDDWGAVISKNLEGCRLMVVLATETYGAKGTEIMGTYEELQYAMRHELPMFIVKMCPKLKESRAAILLEPHRLSRIGGLQASKSQQLLSRRSWMQSTRSSSKDICSL